MLGAMQLAQQLPTGESAKAAAAEGGTPPDAQPAMSAAELAEAAVQHSELVLLQRHVLETLTDQENPGSQVPDDTAVAMLTWLRWNEGQLHPDLDSLTETGMPSVLDSLRYSACISVT